MERNFEQFNQVKPLTRLLLIFFLQVYCRKKVVQSPLKPSGSEVEIFVLATRQEDNWEVKYRPSASEGIAMSSASGGFTLPSLLTAAGAMLN